MCSVGDIPCSRRFPCRFPYFRRALGQTPGRFSDVPMVRERPRAPSLINGSDTNDWRLQENPAQPHRSIQIPACRGARLLFGGFAATLRAVGALESRGELSVRIVYSRFASACGVILPAL